MKIIVDLSKERYKDIQRIASVQADRNHFQTAEQIIANGTPLEQIKAEMAEEVSKHYDEWQYVAGLMTAKDIFEKHMKGESE